MNKAVKMLAVLAAGLSMSVPVHAEENSTVNQPVHVNIPVTVRYEGSYDGKDIAAQYELKRVDEDAPMPSDDDVSTISFKGNGDAEFDEIVYDEPGTYSYEVRQIPGTDKHVKKWDDTVYHVSVCVFSDDEGVLSATVTADETAAAKKKITFTNTTEADRRAPQTGDRPLYGYALAMFGAAILIVVTVHWLKTE